MRTGSSELPLLEDCEMFRVRHGRETSLASAMLRMILTACFEGHTLCDPPRPVNAIPALQLLVYFFTGLE